MTSSNSYPSKSILAIVVLMALAAIFFLTGSLTAADPAPDFEVETSLNRGGPELTVTVIRQPSVSNWSYDLHVATSDGLDQHLEMRNGQALAPGDVRLADLNADGFLDLMVVGGEDHRGEPWFKTWLYHPKDKMYRWINEK